MVKFSVMILCYNPEWSALRRTIDSVLLQKDIEWELIFADDCSQNDCIQKATEYLEERDYTEYQICHHEKNVGTVNNIFDALALAKGEYLKCIGAGDCLFQENTLKEIYDFMKTQKCTMCYGRMQAYRLENDKMILETFCFPKDIKAHEKGKNVRIQKNIIENHGWIVGASMFYRTDKFRQYMKQICGVVTYCEDLLQVLLLLHQETIKYYPEGVMYYELGTGISTNVGTGNEDRMQKDHQAFWNMAVDQEKGNRQVIKGYQLFQMARIENALVRRLKIGFSHMGLIIMLLRTLLQRKRYVIQTQGMIDQLIEQKEG